METDKLLDESLKLAKLTFLFGRTFRVTKHEDGITPESDTDHTVMIVLLGCALAAKFQPDLDLGLIAQIGTIHDLVEAKVGDTDTRKILSSNEKFSKAERERLAFEEIKEEFAFLPWVAETIELYEKMEIPNAITNKNFISVEEMENRHLEQKALVLELSSWKWLNDLWALSCEECVKVLKNVQ